MKDLLFNITQNLKHRVNDVKNVRLEDEVEHNPNYQEFGCKNKYSRYDMLSESLAIAGSSLIVSGIVGIYTDSMELATMTVIPFYTLLGYRAGIKYSQKECK
jgi:hypothetical protein